MPCDPSGLKITMIQVENPATAAIARRDWASGASTASGPGSSRRRGAGPPGTGPAAGWRARGTKAPAPGRNALPPVPAASDRRRGTHPAGRRQPDVLSRGGDFSFSHQPTWLRLFSIMLMFAGVIATALLVAFVADLLLSRRFAYSAGRRRARHLRNHVIVVGLGSFGSRVVSDLTAAGYDVAVIERDENNRFLSSAAELDVPARIRSHAGKRCGAAFRVRQRSVHG
ncbi:hypothetical protein MSIMFI_02841 [Mycobacterium simulans]|nr:hypothetical protein MSIMFI_02841 [Mycobacterium simulans]